MADLLFKKRILITALLLIFCKSAYSYESSFPFPFEFGHSSDIYLDVKKPETKKIRQQNQKAQELLEAKGIKRTPEDFVNYIKKNDKVAIALLLDAGFDPNQNINSSFPLYYAARYNRPEIIDLLISSGANPKKDLTSPVRFTILHKDYYSTKILLEAGADANYRDMTTNETLLYTALKKKEYDIARLLIQKGAKPDNESCRLISNKKLERQLGVSIK